MTEQAANGRPGWRDLREAENRMTEALKEHENCAEERFRLGELRVDAIESFLDQLRGAKYTITALIGTNLLLAGVTIWSMFIEPAMNSPK